MKKYLIKEEHGGYFVGNYLREIENYSSRSLKKAQIFIGSKQVRLDKKLRKGDLLRVMEEEKEVRVKPVKMELAVVYEDEEIFILNKPPYLLTHPTLKNEAISLANGIVYYYKEKGIDMVPRFYNRLDMNTSGIIVVAKTAHAQAYLQNHGELKKYYQAVAKGIVEKDDFILDGKIAISKDGIKREISDSGQEAATHVRVLKRLHEENLTIVELELYTGRTHQIRVHLSSCGHPILGDELYGGGDLRAKRQMLHSYKTILRNPKTKLLQTFEVGLPEDFFFSSKGK